MDRVSEPFVRSKIAMILELKLCLSTLGKGIEDKGKTKLTHFSQCDICAKIKTLFVTGFRQFSKQGRLFKR